MPKQKTVRRKKPVKKKKQTDDKMDWKEVTWS